MFVKDILDEDFVNYKKPSMLIACCSCSFKCDKLAGDQVCQNGTLASAPNIEIAIDKLVQRYISNTISQAVVFGGLEPFDDIVNVLSFVETLRQKGNQDDVVIYTGYTEKEVETFFETPYSKLKQQKNIIIKFGRFIPKNSSNKEDPVLGIRLKSANQYAKRIS